MCSIKTFSSAAVHSLPMDGDALMSKVVGGVDMLLYCFDDKRARWSVCVEEVWE